MFVHSFDKNIENKIIYFATQGVMYYVLQLYTIRQKYLVTYYFNMLLSTTITWNAPNVTYKVFIKL